MRETAVDIDGVSKRFILNQQRGNNLKTYLINAVNGRGDSSEFWALDDVDLTIRAGETFGIIGANGSGKSTLLKLVAGILTPTEGSIDVNGRVAPIISLGVGFDPELTGRENIFLNASLYGLSRREIKNSFDDIVEFSELGDFIEEPIKNYSSGMKMRLGFSIAIHIEPDILLVDEVLAVGDEKFQQKCMDKVHQLKESGKTILFVSHNPENIRNLCSRVCLLDDGHVTRTGKPEPILDEYEGVLDDDHLAERTSSI